MILWFLRLFLAFRQLEESIRMLRRMNDEKSDEVERLKDSCVEYRAKISSQNEAINSLNTKLETEQDANYDLADKSERFEQSCIVDRTEIARQQKTIESMERQLCAVQGELAAAKRIADWFAMRTNQRSIFEQQPAVVHADTPNVPVGRTMETMRQRQERAQKELDSWVESEIAKLPQEV